MDIYGQIGSRLREINGNGFRSTVIFTAHVEEITETTCTVSLGGMKLSDVRLRSVINKNDEQLLIIPKVKSYVTVADLSGGQLRELCVIAYSEIESIHMKIKDSNTDQDLTLDMDSNGIVINGGTIGAVKADKMTAWMEKVYDDLQTLKTQLQSQPVAGNGAPLNLVFDPTTEKPITGNFEDKKLLHG